METGSRRSIFGQPEALFDSHKRTGCKFAVTLLPSHSPIRVQVLLKELAKGKRFMCTGKHKQLCGFRGLTPEIPVAPAPRRFHGSVKLDPVRIGRDAGRIGEEVVQHLSGLVGVNVEVTLEIQANFPGGAPEKTVRDVTENCRTLKFESYGFEED